MRLTKVKQIYFEVLKSHFTSVILGFKTANSLMFSLRKVRAVRFKFQT